jgi:hypothetical protein
MTDIIIERYITSTRDMDDIEAAITFELGGENNRCSVLRSQSYLRFRMSALYKEEQAPCVAYLTNLKLALHWTDRGKRVTLRRLDSLEYNDTRDDGQESQEPQTPREGPDELSRIAQRRRRTSAL